MLRMPLHTVSLFKNISQTIFACSVVKTSFILIYSFVIQAPSFEGVAYFFKDIAYFIKRMIGKPRLWKFSGGVLIGSQSLFIVGVFLSPCNAKLGFGKQIKYIR